MDILQQRTNIGRLSFPFCISVTRLRRIRRQSWSNVKKIITAQQREVREVKGLGTGLVEAIQLAMLTDWGDTISTEEVYRKTAEEIMNNPEHLRYSRLPLDEEILKSKLTSEEQFVPDKYLQPMVIALDIEVYAYEECLGMIGVKEYRPYEEAKDTRKEIHLILQGKQYHAVVKADCMITNVTSPVSSSSSSIDFEPAKKKRKTKRINIPSDTEDDDMAQKVTEEAAAAKTSHESNIESWTDIFLDQSNSSHVPISKTSFEISPEGMVISSEKDRSPNDLNAVPGDSSSEETLKGRSDPVQQEAISTPAFQEDQELVPGINIQLSPARSVTSNSMSTYHLHQYMARGKGFNMRQFRHIEPEVVDKIPFDIDGDKVYKIDCSEDPDNYFQKYRDGRYFSLNTGSRKGFRGKRKIGQCRGNFQCINDNCPVVKGTGKPNAHQFITRGQEKFCFSCELICIRQDCKAMKVTEFESATKILTVYHSGKHSCKVQVDIRKNDDSIKEALQEYNNKVGSRELGRMKIVKELQRQQETGEFDMGKCQELAETFTDVRRIDQLRQQVTTVQKAEKQSLAAVGTVKSGTDTLDDYLIYRINDHLYNPEESYVMKSSRRSCEVMVHMDKDGPPHPLQQEVCYFDGMHSRTEGWLTLTLWVYYPPMRKLLRLATMEVKGENTKNIYLFWKHLNKMLQKFTGNSSYMFNPRGWMTDENGAMENGILDEFGEDKRFQCYTCQYHFRKCLQLLIKRIPEDLPDVRHEIEVLGLKLLTASTTVDYNEAATKFKKYGSLVPCITSWINWWTARRYHIFPIFRGYDLTCVNMAEIGQSGMKRNKKVSLGEAAEQDVAYSMQQDAEYMQFNEGIGRSSGKGPTVAQEAAIEKRKQMRRAEEFVDQFKERYWDMINVEPDEDNFRSSRKAKHKVPARRTFGIQGTTVTGNTSGVTSTAPVLQTTNSGNIRACSSNISSAVTTTHGQGHVTQQFPTPGLQVIRSTVPNSQGQHPQFVILNTKNVNEALKNITLPIRTNFRGHLNSTVTQGQSLLRPMTIRMVRPPLRTVSSTATSSQPIQVFPRGPGSSGLSNSNQLTSIVTSSVTESTAASTTDNRNGTNSVIDITSRESNQGTGNTENNLSIPSTGFSAAQDNETSGHGVDGIQAEAVQHVQARVLQPGRRYGDNPPLLCFLEKRVTKCYGCKRSFTNNLRSQPNNIIVRRLVNRERLIRGEWVPGILKSWGYFHLSLECLRRESPTMELDQVYMPNDVREKLKPAHINYLIKKDWWKYFQVTEVVTYNFVKFLFSVPQCYFCKLFKFNLLCKYFKM